MQFIYAIFLWNISLGVFYPSMDEFNSSIHFANASQPEEIYPYEYWFYKYK